MRLFIDTGNVRQMLDHPLTDAGAEKFRADWESRPEFGRWLRALTDRSLAGAPAVAAPGAAPDHAATPRE
jgi:hypothetical protein